MRPMRADVGEEEYGARGTERREFEEKRGGGDTGTEGGY